MVAHSEPASAEGHHFLLRDLGVAGENFATGFLADCLRDGVHGYSEGCVAADGAFVNARGSRNAFGGAGDRVDILSTP